MKNTGEIIEFDIIFYDSRKYFSFDRACTTASDGSFYLSIIAAMPISLLISKELGQPLIIDPGDLMEITGFIHSHHSSSLLT